MEDFNFKEIIEFSYCPMPSFYRAKRMYIYIYEYFRFMDKDNPY